MSAMVDAFIAYRILNMLTTPFNKTDAYRLGIIDAHGNLRKKESQLTGQERDAYTLLTRMVFKLKKIIDRTPDSKNFSSLAAATAVIKDSLEHGEESDTLEEEFYILEEENKYRYANVKSFAQLVAEEGVAANSVASGNIQGIDTEPVVSKKRQAKLIRRNAKVAPLKPFQSK
jgi:hypothetical protein